MISKTERIFHFDWIFFFNFHFHSISSFAEILLEILRIFLLNNEMWRDILCKKVNLEGRYKNDPSLRVFLVFFFACSISLEVCVVYK